ncbi:DUF6623 family protein [Coleofasciculus sp. H7-2]|uniref:DUF6623 family protein n=1 Tax=Coleofasciculus sp. H7-2 TaxID=3351545 RepID=UPI00366DE8EA
MGFHASWVHGNALTVENPENLNRVGHFGWGADMQVKPGKASWFHIALPTPVILNDARSNLIRVFLMFESEQGSIRNVHVYDGSSKVQEFNDLLITGEHRIALDGVNTFNLTNPHTVIFGIGVSFLFIADIGFDSAIPPSRLILASSGGDYTT